MSTRRFVGLKLNKKKYEKVFTILDGYVSDNFIVASILFTKAPIKNVKIYRVGIFAPLYLDSIFTTEGKFRKNLELPRFAKPSIDFINGAKIALDSLAIPNQFINVHIFDTKSKDLSLDQLIKLNKIDSLDLIIGSVKDLEFKQLASFALTKNIPFISSTYPNDGGITANPFLVIVNSTLKSHCEAIFANVLQNHGKEKYC